MGAIHTPKGALGSMALNHRLPAYDDHPARHPWHRRLTLESPKGSGDSDGGREAERKSKAGWGRAESHP